MTLEQAIEVLKRNQFMSPLSPNGEAIFSYAEMAGEAAIRDQRDMQDSRMKRLSFSQGICDLHVVWVETEDGKFARFYCEIPASSLTVNVKQWADAAKINGGPYGKNITVSFRRVNINGTTTAVPIACCGPATHCMDTACPSVW